MGRFKLFVPVILKDIEETGLAVNTQNTLFGNWDFCKLAIQARDSDH